MHIYQLFDKVEQIRKALSRLGRGDKFPINVGDLRDAICMVSGVDEVNFERIPATSLQEPSVIKAFVKVYDRSPSPYALPTTVANITYIDNGDTCETQFIVAKELCQLLFQRIPGSRIETSDQMLTLAKALTMSRSAIHAIEPFLPFQTETYARLAAIEVLFPIEIRAKYLAEADINDEFISELSRLFMVPSEDISLVLQPQYHDVLFDVQKRARLHRS